MSIDDYIAEAMGSDTLKVEEIAARLVARDWPNQKMVENIVRTALVNSNEFEHVTGGAYRVRPTEYDDMDGNFTTGGYTEARKRDFARLQATELTAEDEKRIIARLEESHQGRDRAALLARDGLCLINELKRLRVKLAV